MTNKKSAVKLWLAAGLFLVLFFAVILMVKCVDVEAIGPNASEIGLATVNGAVRDFFGVSDLWYTVTDILAYIAFATVGVFAVLGAYQLFSRKSLKKVDHDILLLAVLYVMMAGAYVLFELCIINYRPILVDSVLEASFPSSHTMLVLCIMGSAVYQFTKRIKQKPLCVTAVTVSILIMALTAFGRLVAGVHWFSDILGSICISAALIFAYIAACKTFDTP